MCTLLLRFDSTTLWETRVLNLLHPVLRYGTSAPSTAVPATSGVSRQSVKPLPFPGLKDESKGGRPLASLPPRTLSVQAMASALLEMQAVAMGRLDVGGAVVLIDDGVAAVLADSALLSVLLNGGAARVAALSDAKIGEAAQELVVLAGDLGEHVTRSLLALQAAGGHIRGIVLTAPSSRQRCAQGEVRLSGSAPPVPISWAPLCFAPVPAAKLMMFHRNSILY